MKKQTGFTLIELVVVIVILGILAATAAPKFIDLTGDARSSVVQALQGSLKSARDMAHAKVLVDSATNDSEISIAGENINLTNGWPDADSMYLLIDLDGDMSETSQGSGEFRYIGAVSEASCSVTYTDTPDANTAPEVEALVTGC